MMVGLRCSGCIAPFCDLCDFWAACYFVPRGAQVSSVLTWSAKVGPCEFENIFIKPT